MKFFLTLFAVVAVATILSPSAAIAQCYECRACYDPYQHFLPSTSTPFHGYQGQHSYCVSGLGCSNYHQTCYGGGLAAAEEETIVATILDGVPTEIAATVQLYESVSYDPELHTIVITGCNDAVKAWIPLANDIRASLALQLRKAWDTGHRSRASVTAALGA